MRICITGATGSLGQALVRRLLKDGAERIVVFSRDEVKQARMAEAIGDPPPMRWMLGDVRDRDRLESAFWGCEAVVHAAALKRVDGVSFHPTEVEKTNITGTRNVLEAAVRAGVKKVLVISSDKACLDWHSPVLLEDGCTRPIGELDREWKAVQSVQDQDIVSRPITAWYKNALAGRPMVEVRAKDHGGYVRVTADHLLLTPSGWRKADELRNGDPVVIGEPAPNPMQHALITGGLLGDMSITATGQLALSHAENQREWLEIKLAALNGFRFYRRVDPPRRGRQRQYSARATTSVVWRQLRQEWYPGGRKRVNRSAVVAAIQSFSDLFLAVWYGDDGTLADGWARLATHGFPSEDTEWLVDELRKIGLECRPYQVRVQDKIYTEIRFSRVGADQLFARIGILVPPSVSHKLPTLFRGRFEKDHWHCGQTHLATACVQMKPWAYRKIGAGKRERRNSAQHVYCIDVGESHNFIVNGFVLHNCYPTNLYGASKFFAEQMAVAANRYAWPRGTRIGAVRYGNVLGSRGSAAHVFRRQAMLGQPLTITDPDMTRFIITMDQAVQFCLQALKDLQGGEILVPMLPSARVWELALAAADVWNGQTTSPASIVGRRPGGEKLHETLLSEDEVTRAVRQRIIDPRYVVPPRVHDWDPGATWAGEPVPAGFRYSSDSNGWWLPAAALVPLLREIPEEML